MIWADKFSRKFVGLFRLFEICYDSYTDCTDGKPTYLYTYEQVVVADKLLGIFQSVVYYSG